MIAAYDAVARVVGEVGDRVDLHEQADTGGQQEHDGAQRVDEERHRDTEQLATVDQRRLQPRPARRTGQSGRRGAGTRPPPHRVPGAPVIATAGADSRRLTARHRASGSSGAVIAPDLVDVDACRRCGTARARSPAPGRSRPRRSRSRTGSATGRCAAVSANQASNATRLRLTALSISSTPSSISTACAGPARRTARCRTGADDSSSGSSSGISARTPAARGRSHRPARRAAPPLSTSNGSTQSREERVAEPLGGADPMASRRCARRRSPATIVAPSATVVAAATTPASGVGCAVDRRPEPLPVGARVSISAKSTQHDDRTDVDQHLHPGDELGGQQHEAAPPDAPSVTTSHSAACTSWRLVTTSSAEHQRHQAQRGEDHRDRRHAVRLRGTRLAVGRLRLAVARPSPRPRAPCAGSAAGSSGLRRRHGPHPLAEPVLVVGQVA